jgi:hypothetical protein
VKQTVYFFAAAIVALEPSNMIYDTFERTEATNTLEKGEVKLGKPQIFLGLGFFCQFLKI